MENYYGFELIKDMLLDREVIIVIPKEGTSNGKWILKTEYFEAFPNTQIELLKNGYHLVHIKNVTRWNLPEDTQSRAELAEYMHNKYKLCKKCAIIGMSCGGIKGIYFAAEYPQYVSCMYLDAPVVNLLSCPADLGKAKSGLMEEFEKDRGIGISELIAYRNHPLDKLPKLVQHNIPIFLVCGDSDTVVPYEENGALIKRIYEENDCVIKTIIKNNCGHHPHGLDDCSPIVDFVNTYYKFE